MSILLGRLLLTMSFTIMTMACSDKVSQTASNSSIYGTWFMDDMVIDGKSAQFDDGKGNSLKVNKEFSITLAKDEIIFSKLCQSNKKFSKKAAAVISSTRIELLGRVDTSCEGNGDEVWQNIVWEVIKIDEATLHTSDDLDSGYIVWKRR